MMFLALCIGVILLSQLLAWIGVSATYEVVQPPPQQVEAEYVGGSTLPAETMPCRTTGRGRLRGGRARPSRSKDC